MAALGQIISELAQQLEAQLAAKYAKLEAQLCILCRE